MKRKIVPVLIVLLLILVVGAAGMTVHMIQKYTPTDERMDTAAYYQVTDDARLPLVFGTELLEKQGLLSEGEIFLPQDVVLSYLNKRFYWDPDAGIMIYTTPTEKYVIEPEMREYMIGGEQSASEDYTICILEGDALYINVRFVQKFTDIDYQLWEQPNRLVLQYQWKGVSVVETAEDAPVRYRGGIKSEILTDVAAGTQLRLIEELEDWDQVATADGFIGYIQKKYLAGDVSVIDMERSFSEPEYTSISRDHKINLAWHQVASEIANDTLEDAVKNAKGINVISPTWFSISGNDGSISNFATEDYVTKAHGMGLEVWGLVDNFSDKISSHQVLSHTKSRTNLEENIVAQAVRFSLDGINIDFEALEEPTGPHFVQFLRELSILCRSSGLVLSVDNYVPDGYSDFYDRKTQGEVADYVIIMGYDEHFLGSEEAGSVASLPWVERGIQQTIEDVPAEKVINGVPFFTRIWKTSAGVVTSEAVGMDEAAQFVQAHNMETYWDEDYGQNYGEYSDGNDQYQIWLEDEKSLAAKVELIQKYGLAGVAEWKLGLERDDVWDVISKGLS